MVDKSSKYVSKGKGQKQSVLSKEETKETSVYIN